MAGMTVRGVCRAGLGLAAAAAAAVPLAPAQAAQRTTHVTCWMYDSQEEGYFSRPRTCAFHVMGSAGSAADIVDTEKLRWRGWGRRVATARGVRLGSGGYRVPVTVRLSGRVKCESSYLYRNVRFSSRGQRPFGFRLIGCPL